MPSVLDKLKQYRQDLIDKSKLHEQIEEIKDKSSAYNQHKSAELNYEECQQVSYISSELQNFQNIPRPVNAENAG
ncbi:15592_t:CDS:2 [Gigaspora margarita]|uniref:15592_t:CDS:1 n=1 Tax=Gigaspora margarita TaxID=4874 RepID=A0ABM8W170_GIGMA|nr:15592_t:CDS:2 [Gigaspora margarita]